jgi:hypothetical protein
VPNVGTGAAELGCDEWDLSSTRISGATNDQRGYIRPFDKANVPNAAGGDGADIGAFETGTRTNLVTNVNSSGAGSLRQAILDAGIEDITTINFQPGIVGNTIGFGGQMILDRDIIINGPGASLMSITPDFGQRVFQVDSHKTVIYGLTFRDCLVFGEDASSGADGGNERGGAILNSGDLSLFDCAISNNIVQGGAGGDMNGGFAGNGGIGRGGGIANFGTLALTRCTLATNSALGGLGGLSDNPDNDGYGGDSLGGGLYSEGSVHLTNCTVYANRAIGGSSPVGSGTATGGGICNYANNPLDLSTCTVAANIAFSGSGGGIYDAGSSGVYRNSTIALNQSGSGGGLHASGCNIGNCIIAANNNGGTGPDIQGGFNSSDYNLIQAGNGWFTTGGSITYTIVGLNPLLGPLQNNGGPTLTMALLPGSPADRSRDEFRDHPRSVRPRPAIRPARDCQSPGGAREPTSAHSSWSILCCTSPVPPIVRSFPGALTTPDSNCRPVPMSAPVFSGPMCPECLPSPEPNSSLSIL